MYLKNKTKMVSFRLSSYEYDLLKHIIIEKGVSASDIFRNYILKEGVLKNDRQTN